MRLFMIFIALVVAVAAGVGFWFVTSNSSSPESPVLVQQPAPTTVAVEEQTILVARNDIPVGKRIAENDIDYQTWPKNLVIEEFMPKGQEVNIIDMVARTPFKAREPLTKSRLANPNDPSFLAAQLPKGMRAVTVAIDSITGIAGFVFPGDRVDVVIRHRVALEQDFEDGQASAATEKDAPKAKAVTAIPMPISEAYQTPVLMEKGKADAQPGIEVTEVLLNNIKVLAVGQYSHQYNGAENGAIPTSITLQVSDLDAQKLRHADAGQLSLALRSLEDAEDASTPRAISNTDMSSLTPPAYFPFAYKREPYQVRTVELEDTGYVDAEPTANGLKGQNKNQITIIRGVQKEIVGVNNQ